MTDQIRSFAHGDAGITVRASSVTHIGRHRTTNEDAILVAPPLYAVADGMGGHNAGEVASAIAVEEFRTLSHTGPITIEQFGATLSAAAHKIASLPGPDQQGAGTTFAMVATMDVDGVSYWVVMNLGDSRVYRLSGDIFEQVSVDHSVVQELLDRGDITAEEARRHPYRNMITRALGVTRDAEPDFWLIPTEPGDRMLICSDGLSGEVADPMIERVLRSAATLESVAGSLLELALESGGHDNISIVALEAHRERDSSDHEDTVRRSQSSEGRHCAADDEDTHRRSPHAESGESW